MLYTVKAISNENWCEILTPESAASRTIPSPLPVTIVASQATSEGKVDSYTKYNKTASLTVEVVPTSAASAITELKATKVNELVATFASAVDKDDIKLEVTKGTSTTPVEMTVNWNEDNTVATITTTAKMTVGTYTVKATATSDGSTAEKSVEIESQYVAEIQVLNSVALTGKDAGGKDAMEAYVYYKVVDQYGEDLTASTSIQWSTSSGDPKVVRSEGKLVLTRTDDKAFTYGEQLYVTGVYAKTGISTNATLTIGAAQAVNSIEMKGFVKKNTSALVTTLPVGFKSNEYYLVFDALDQNGNAMTADAALGSDVTFISDNVLVIREVKSVSNIFVIGGHEYNAALVTPGDYVSRGGEVNITAIATKTGKQTVQNYTVGQNQILTSFAMSAPNNVVADGEKAEIPFVALDQDGEAITSFVTLADNLNKLTFSTSDGIVYLKEENDGTASLWYQDKAVNWTDSAATDGIDRTVSITSLVVGGNSDNMLLYISDKARPDAISDVDIKSVFVENTEVGIDLDKFTFLDQYGRKMLPVSKDGVGDNGFFNATSGGAVNGRDFSGYAYDVVMQFKGNNQALVTDASILVDNASKALISTSTTSIAMNLNGKAGSPEGAAFVTEKKTKTSMTGNNFIFTIAKVKTADFASVEKYENVSTNYTKEFTVVDITQVKNFTVDDLNKQFVATSLSAVQTGQIGGIQNSGGNGSTTFNIASPVGIGRAAINSGYGQEVTLKGTYNGVSVTIPKVYYAVVGRKVGTTDANLAADLGDNKIAHVSTSAVKWSDLYDATTSNYLRKDTADTLEIKVYEVYSNADATMGADLTLGAILKDSVNKQLAISDATPVVTTINAEDTYTINPTNTEFAANTLLTKIQSDNTKAWKATVVDQYGVSMDSRVAFSYKITKVEEAAGYVDNNFTVTGNDTGAATIAGAERGDTFVLTITASDGRSSVSKDITITVGADTNASVNQSTNVYTDTLKKDHLETQRNQILGNN